MATTKRELFIQDELGDEHVVVPFKYAITSYGADYDVRGIVHRIKDEDIYVPRFQRGYVWNYHQASRFIETLLLGLPVPGIFLAREAETNRLLVVDGQQRLKTLLFFYEGVFGPNERAFSLVDVQEQFEGLSYKKLDQQDRRRLDDSILHATVIKQDVPSEDDSSIYHVFERLNTGGTRLQPQEIRACIYHGEFNEALDDLNKTKSWRSIFGAVNKRMRDKELILRYFALLYHSNSYKRPMVEFLNRYMGANRHLQKQQFGQLRTDFVEVIDIVFESVGKRAFKPERAFNAAVFDSVMVGISRRLSNGRISKITDVGSKYRELIKDADFQEVCSTSTSQEDRLEKRLKIATRYFHEVD
ncbi:MAG: DUF262 domain-containing protein [Planctomycetes bacterium]|nr:DUF262 domain-containing protein [Planctomycetota bacterium]